MSGPMIAFGTDLKRRLLRPGIDREILCEVLQNSYQTTYGSVEDLRFGDQQKPSITLKWTPKGDIGAIFAAKDLDDEEISKIEAALLEAIKPTAIQYHRFPLFSHRPVGGAIGFDSWFQIVPASPEVPQPMGGWGNYVSI